MPSQSLFSFIINKKKRGTQPRFQPSQNHASTSPDIQGKARSAYRNRQNRFGEHLAHICNFPILICGYLILHGESYKYSGFIFGIDGSGVKYVALYNGVSVGLQQTAWFVKRFGTSLAHKYFENTLLLHYKDTRQDDDGG